jgi:hypothetical protein
MHGEGDEERSVPDLRLEAWVKDYTVVGYHSVLG